MECLTCSWQASCDRRGHNQFTIDYLIGVHASDIYAHTEYWQKKWLLEFQEAGCGSCKVKLIKGILNQIVWLKSPHHFNRRSFMMNCCAKNPDLLDSSKVTEPEVDKYFHLMITSL